MVNVKRCNHQTKAKKKYDFIFFLTLKAIWVVKARWRWKLSLDIVEISDGMVKTLSSVFTTSRLASSGPILFPNIAFTSCLSLSIGVRKSNGLQPRAKSKKMSVKPLASALVKVLDAASSTSKVGSLGKENTITWASINRTGVRVATRANIFSLLKWVVALTIITKGAKFTSSPNKERSWPSAYIGAITFIIVSMEVGPSRVESSLIKVGESFIPILPLPPLVAQDKDPLWKLFI